MSKFNWIFFSINGEAKFLKNLKTSIGELT